MFSEISVLFGEENRFLKALHPKDLVPSLEKGVILIPAHGFAFH